MSKWQPIGTMPRDGTKVLVYIHFQDADPQPGAVIGSWQEDSRGFNIKGDEGCGGWHIKGAWAWMPLPDGPALSTS